VPDFFPERRPLEAAMDAALGGAVNERQHRPPDNTATMQGAVVLRSNSAI